MGSCLAVWFAPFVSGVLCNEIEQRMVRAVLTALGTDPTDVVVDSLFWCCRKKLLVLNALTYVPILGTSLQLLEVYALGQFTLHAATHDYDLTNEQLLSESWAAIEQQMFSGDRVVRSYKEFTGNKFPEVIKIKFIPAVDTIGNLYRRAEQIPGVMRSQAIAGTAIRGTVRVSKKVAGTLWKRVTCGRR
jgi:hypothetical protein